MKKNVRRAAAVAMMMAMILSGCGKSEESAAPAAADATPETKETAAPEETAAQAPETGDAEDQNLSGKRAVLLVKKLSSSYWTELEAAAKDKCEEYGWTMETLCPVTADSNEEQIQLLEQSLLDPPDVYLLAPADSEGITPAIEKINEAGVPIINLATKITGEGLEYVTFVGVEYYDIATSAAEALVDLLGGEGSVLILEGTTGSQTSTDIKAGADDVFAKNSGITVLDSQPANYQRQEALTVTQNLLQKYPEVDAIFASNGEMALGAAEAVRQAGRDGIKICALNCSEELVQAIADGKIAFTADDVSWKMGEQASVAAMDYFKGVTMEKERMQDAVIVNEDNLSEYKAKYGIQ